MRGITIAFECACVGMSFAISIGWMLSQIVDVPMDQVVDGSLAGSGLMFCIIAIIENMRHKA